MITLLLIVLLVADGFDIADRGGLPGRRVGGGTREMLIVREPVA